MSGLLALSTSGHLLLSKDQKQEKTKRKDSGIRCRGDFLKKKIEYLSSLTSVPLDMILSDDTRRKLDDQCIPSISEYDSNSVCWFIAREIIKRHQRMEEIIL